jgi:hypothetical protein
MASSCAEKWPVELAARVDYVDFVEIGFKKWTKDNQKSSKNSPYIYQAVMDVARKRGHKIGEFKIIAN